MLQKRQMEGRMHSYDGTMKEMTFDFAAKDIRGNWKGSQETVIVISSQSRISSMGVIKYILY
ncbi:hypothetical protein Selli1_15200 [Sellimonas catena]|uniref:Uncharacterized protein n=1 Tax=Sellimonas catena TaxID=2994035 RepID=A0A9W6FE88_9FIRM|nr:hypothetical protein Selli1_15200 [Sellimonas catena]